MIETTGSLGYYLNVSCPFGIFEIYDLMFFPILFLLVLVSVFSDSHPPLVSLLY